LADLIEGGLAEGDRPAVLLSEGEPPDAMDERLPGAGRWRLIAAAGVEPAMEAELPAGATHIFIVADGRRNPVDQVEAFKSWLVGKAAEVARVICVVDCHLAEKHPRLFAWFEACIHFSDVVLLNHRDGVPNKWVGDFRARFEDKFYPCLFEFVKAGSVKNPALVLAPVARRMSHVFDEQEWIVADEEEEDIEEGDEEVEMKPEEDPYLERRNGGRRVHEIPHIEEFLPKTQA
jgi:G3E family GTPase